MNSFDGLKDNLEELECTDGDSTPIYRQVLTFMDEIFEIAFGEDAIKKGYSEDEVIAKLKEFSTLSLNPDGTAKENV